jgi:predicted 2-oxoglutarate/Fe(II)-dependent dioxygenase YbiX
VNDKGYHRISRRSKTGGKFNLEYYETSTTVDARIRNAVTGCRYKDDHPKLKYLVGSRQEDLFFKTAISNRDNVKNSPVFLFYDNPEQFEKHQRVTLSRPIKEKWTKKNLECRLQNMRFCNNDKDNDE